MSTPFTLGIDLGTTNTYVAIKYKDQEPKLVFFEMGRVSGDNKDELKTNISKKAQFPSIVDISKQNAGKSTAAAYVSAIRSGKSVKGFVRNFKRDLENNKVHKADEYEYTSVEVLQIFVQKLLEQVLKHQFKTNVSSAQLANYFFDLGLTKIAVTVPSAWKNEKAHEKGKVMDAFINLGFEEDNMILLYEPVAAATYIYSIGDNFKPKRYAVIDLGGGTSDYAIVLLNKPDGVMSSKIEFHGGNPYLGGKDFDESIFYKITKPYFVDNPSMGKYIAEDVKIEYSNIKNDILYEKNRAGFIYSHQLATNVDEAILSNLDMCANDVDNFFQGNILQNPIDELLLVGGLSLFSPVYEAITNIVSRNIDKQLSSQQSDELTFCSIALGASIMAEEGNVVEEVLDKDIMMRVKMPTDILSMVTKRCRLVFGYQSLYKFPYGDELYLLPLFKKGSTFLEKPIQSSFEKIYGQKLSFEGSIMELNIVFDDYNKLLNGENQPKLLNVKHKLEDLNDSYSFDFDLTVSANGILNVILINSFNQFVIEKSIKFKA